MPKLKPFAGIRPRPEKVLEVIVRPFDNFGTEQAKKILESNPYSFLHVIEPSLGNGYLRGSQEEIIHLKARENFENLLNEGTLIKEQKPSLYIYRETRNNQSQTGIWACSSIDDYLNNTIRKHELTRAEREVGLIKYLENTSVDANPVLMTYEPDPKINKVISQTVKNKPLYDFVTHTDIRHELWCLSEEHLINAVVEAFAAMPCAYIADGHHRAAAASLLGMQKRISNLKHHGSEDYNFFTSLYFSTDQIQIYEFHRLVKDLNGLNKEEFIDRIAENFLISKANSVYKPDRMHHFGMYLDKEWYVLSAKPLTYNDVNSVGKLDVTIIHDYLLDPVLGIKDARTDRRIDFVGGIKNINEVIQRVDSGEMKVAFTLYPTSIEQLMEVADNGEVMPPKSTWFEPKLHCGLLVHQI